MTQRLTADQTILLSGMTDTQRFLFDLHGYLLIEDALSPEEVKKYRDAIYRLAREKVADPSRWDERGEPQDGLTVHRPIEKDPVFLEIVDHPAVLPVLQQLVGEAPILIDNDAELSPRHSHRKGWHRGVGTHGFFVEDGQFFCTMVKCIWYLSDVRKGENATRIIPGSHKSRIAPSWADGDRAADLPGQVELEVRAGTVLIFSEACLHAGNINPSDRTRVNMYFNYGPSWVQPWEGYRPSERLVSESQGIRRQLLGGGRIYSTTEEEGRSSYQ
jgi:ectoine hydroxylase-related dioxygenase (phytanoyl-CoA dioxygenase family)